mmetsp:Transcript_75814/g.149886  ORF Transcript_75814/g.149886 Transcript_75814/m.149886 type:complete len:231 (+) Transcript_75814:1306-1998(+)
MVASVVRCCRSNGCTAACRPSMLVIPAHGVAIVALVSPLLLQHGISRNTGLRCLKPTIVPRVCVDGRHWQCYRPPPVMLWGSFQQPTHVCSVLLRVFPDQPSLDRFDHRTPCLPEGRQLDWIGRCTVQPRVTDLTSDHWQCIEAPGVTKHIAHIAVEGGCNRAAVWVLNSNRVPEVKNLLCRGRACIVDLIHEHQHGRALWRTDASAVVALSHQDKLCVSARVLPPGDRW